MPYLGYHGTPSAPYPYFGQGYPPRFTANIPPRHQQRSHNGSNSTASSSNATLVNDEMVRRPWPEFMASQETAPVESKALTHLEWVQQFAEQARQAHLRNSGHPVFAPASSPFNPHAVPFVPAAIRAHAAAAAAAPPESPTYGLEVETCHFQVQHPWVSNLRRGSVTSDTKVRRVQTELVVSMGPWDAITMADLCTKLSDRAAEGFGPELATVAPFARDLYDCFKSELGEPRALQFCDHLRESVLAEYIAWWKADLPTSVIHLKYQDKVKAQAFLSSALAVAAFVADLFVQRLILPEFVHHCLSLLTRDLRVIEQLHAVHAIISHADEHLYETRAMTSLMAALAAKGAALQNGASAVGQTFDKTEVEACVQDILGTIHKWAGARSVPPSTERNVDGKADYLYDSSKRTAVPPPAALPGPNGEHLDAPRTDQSPGSITYSDIAKKDPDVAQVTM